jgi:hypothetical protein
LELELILQIGIRIETLNLNWIIGIEMKKYELELFHKTRIGIDSKTRIGIDSGKHELELELI